MHNIRTGFLIQDTWTGITGRVIAAPQDKYGNYTVLTRQNGHVITAQVQAFNARIISTIAPAKDDILHVTNGARNYVGSILGTLDNGEFEMALTGLAGTVAVHPSQMYQLVARAAIQAVA